VHVRTRTGAAAAADEQRVAGKHGAAGQQEAHAAVRVAGRGANLKVEGAECDFVAVHKLDVCGGAARGGDGGAQARDAPAPRAV
jgi:hypothetical protein